MSSATQRMHPAQLTFPQRPVITAAACSRQLAMVYDQSPTDLAFALLPVFATLWSEQVSAVRYGDAPRRGNGGTDGQGNSSGHHHEGPVAKPGGGVTPPRAHAGTAEVPLAAGRIRGVAADKTQKTTPPDRHFDQLPLACSTGPG